MTDRYERIRDALAMEPTPGPRTMLADEKILGLALPGRWVVEADGAFICLDPEWEEECYEESIANAALIAACDPDTIRELLAERDQLAAALEAAREDAERYRWLRSLNGACDAAARVTFNIGFDWIEQHGEELDAAIDQARGKGVE
jgi:hypothetical protein